ncbi:MAG: glycosyltransferase family 4 protein [Bacillus sp. (in: Bacteria)]|nr:glycosyltransferase family 4 protein [Bacillus sp. (in: firmicutes)]
MNSIIIVTPNYTPETCAAAKRITATAEYLNKHGWKVTVITVAPHYPQNCIYEGYGKKFLEISIENQVKVVRFRPWIVPKSNLILRLFSETLFSLQAAWYIFRCRSSVVMSTSPYMLLGPFCLLASRIKRSRFIWEVRDLTWQYVSATGKKSYGLIKPLEYLMLLTASFSDALITTTNGQLEYFKTHLKCLPPIALVIPNGVSDFFLNSTKQLAYKGFFQKKEVKVVYAGLLGYPQGLTTLIKTAKLLPNIKFILVGEGVERLELERQAKIYKLNNIQFTGYMELDNLLTYYSEADILVAHLRRNFAFEIAQPSKLWEYMSTGRPVVFGGEGEAADIIRQNDCGSVVPPDNPEALAEAITYLVANPDEAQRLGKNGRLFVETHRRSDVILEKLQFILEQLTIK